jgi:hypothetical protein
MSCCKYARKGVNILPQTSGGFMSIKHRSISAVAVAVLFLGCGNKPTESLPPSTPVAAKEPNEILKNLQHLGTRKDLKHISVISLTDLNVAYEAACQLHRHAGDLGIVLKDQDIMDLGVTDLRTKGYLVPGASHLDLLEAKKKEATGGKMLPWMAKLDPQKLDQLPVTDTLPDGRPNPEYLELKRKYADSAMKAGIYRIVSGVPEAMWAKLSVLETKPDPQSSDVQIVSVGLKGTPVLEVAVMKNKTGSYGIYNLSLKKTPKQLLVLLDENK